MTKRKRQANLKPTEQKRQIIWNWNLGTKTQRLKPKIKNNDQQETKEHILIGDDQTEV